MAKQRYINTRFWRDSYIENLDPTEKLLFIYFLTNPDTNISGVYELPIKIIAVDIGIDRDMVIKLLARFEKDEKIRYRNGWIAIKNFTLYQSMNPKIIVGIENELKNAPPEVVEWVNLNEKIAYDSLSHSNTNKNTNKNKNTNEDDKSAPKEKKPYTVILEKHYELYEAKFKRKYNFSGADGVAIKNILKQKYTLDEILGCLDRYFNNNTLFYQQQGYTLKYFQSAISGLILGNPTDNGIDIGFQHASIEDGQALYEKALKNGDLE